MSERGPWWWCLNHARVEPQAGCANRFRLGPFETSEEAAQAIQRAHERADKWDEDERAWREGTSPRDPDGGEESA